VSIVPLERQFLDLSNGNKFQNVNFLLLLFLDENPGQKCDYLEMPKNEGDVFCISQSYMSLQWKITKRGCTARKGNEFVCMCCNILGKHMATPQETCDTCEARNDPAQSPYLTESSCFHKFFDIDCI
jgi:hypothetical protein